MNLVCKANIPCSPTTPLLLPYCSPTTTLLLPYYYPAAPLLLPYSPPPLGEPFPQGPPPSSLLPTTALLPLSSLLATYHCTTPSLLRIKVNTSFTSPPPNSLSSILQLKLLSTQTSSPDDHQRHVLSSNQNQ